MRDDHSIPDDEFADNPAARTPVCLVLDVSGSMDGDPIRELQEGVELLFKEIREDEYASASAEIAIVTFSNDAKKQQGFANVENATVPKLTAEGYTMMGKGVDLAIDLLEERKMLYKKQGIDYHQPWMVLMTDGRPENEPEAVTNAAALRTTNLVNSKKLVIFPIGIGAAADFDVLSMFSPAFTPLKLQGLKFKEFFKWLSQSVSEISGSIPGQTPPLNKDGIREWADIKGWDETL